MFTGDPVTDRNMVIEQYWKANKKRLDSMSALRRKVDAAILLGENPKKIEQEMDNILDNEEPFQVTEKTC